MSDYKEKLYGQLKEKVKGFTIPYEQFAKDMQDGSKMKSLYANLQKAGTFELPNDFDSFSASMFGEPKNEKPKAGDEWASNLTEKMEADKNRYVRLTAGGAGLTNEDKEELKSKKPTADWSSERMGKFMDDLQRAKENTAKEYEKHGAFSAEGQRFAIAGDAYHSAYKGVKQMRSQKDQNGFADFIEGVGDEAGKRDTYTLGVSDMELAGFLISLSSKIDEETGEVKKGEELTGGEYAIMDALKNKQWVDDRSDYDFGYQLGSGTMASVPFMIQFAATSGVGAATKQVVTKTLLKGAKRMALGRIKNKTAKKAIKVGMGTLAKGSQALAQTALMPSTYSDAVQEHYGSVEQKVDGSLGFDPETRTGWGEAFRHSITENFVENFTEALGGEIVTDGVKNGLTKVFGKNTLKSAGNFKPIRIAKELNRGLKASKIGQAIHFDGYAPEVVEEYMATPLKGLLSGDFEELKTWEDWETHAQTFAQTAIVTGVMGGGVYANNAKNRMAYKRALSKAHKLQRAKLAEMGFSEQDIVGLEENLTNNSANEAVQGLARIVGGVNSFSKEQKEEIIKFANLKFQQAGVQGGIQEQIDNALNKQVEQINELTNENGQFIKAKDQNGAELFAVGDSKIAMNEDGTVDFQNSDAEIVVTDGLSGERKMVSIKSLSDIEVQNVEELKGKMQNAIATQFQMQDEQESAEPQLEQGEKVNVSAPNGEQEVGEITGFDAEGNTQVRIGGVADGKTVVVPANSVERFEENKPREEYIDEIGQVTTEQSADAPKEFEVMLGKEPNKMIETGEGEYRLDTEYQDRKTAEKQKRALEQQYEDYEWRIESEKGQGEFAVSTHKVVAVKKGGATEQVQLSPMEQYEALQEKGYADDLVREEMQNEANLLRTQAEQLRKGSAKSSIEERIEAKKQASELEAQAQEYELLANKGGDVLNTYKAKREKALQTDDAVLPLRSLVAKYFLAGNKINAKELQSELGIEGGSAEFRGALRLLGNDAPTIDALQESLLQSYNAEQAEAISMDTNAFRNTVLEVLSEAGRGNMNETLSDMVLEGTEANTAKAEQEYIEQRRAEYETTKRGLMNSGYSEERAEEILQGEQPNVEQEVPAEFAEEEYVPFSKKRFEYFTGSISDMFTQIKNSGNNLVKKIVSPVSSRLLRDLSNNGLEISEDFNHVIDNSAIQHVLNRHGEGKEQAENQEPVTEHDFERIDEVVNGYDKISLSQDKGNTTIKYQKTFPDGTTIYIEEVRKGRKELALKTLYKKRANRSGVLMSKNSSNSTANPLPDSSLLNSNDKGTNNFEETQKSFSKTSAPTVDVNGLPFVESSEGNIVFGAITPSVSEQIGRQSAPILLSEGNQAYGETHIEERRGNEIREFGYASVRDFTADVAKNYNEVRKGEKGELIVAKRNGKDKMAVIRLTPTTNGDVYSVTTGAIVRKSYMDKKELLWQSEPAKENTTNSSVSYSDNEGSGNVEPNANSSNSNDKGTQLSEKDQIVSDKLQELSANNPKALPIVVVEKQADLDTHEELNEGVRQSIQVESKQGNVINAFVANGKVFFVLENIESEQRALELWIHEQGIHAGLDAVFGENKAKILSLVANYLKEGKGNQSLYAKLQKTYKGSSDVQIAEEYLAHLAEKQVQGEAFTEAEQTIWDKFKGILQQFIDVMYHTNYTLSDKQVGMLVQATVAEMNKQGETVESSENNAKFAKSNKGNEVSKRVPQGKHGTQEEEVGGTAETWRSELEGRIAENARNAQADSREVSRTELEARTTEEYAKEKGVWHSYSDVLSMGNPYVSGNENDNYLSDDAQTVYKVNNLINNKGLISATLDNVSYHNEIFSEIPLDFVGFTGFDGGSVYPVFKQQYIENATEASPSEIADYMQKLGFEQVNATTFTNGVYTVSDLRPRNVLKDAEGDIYVIDSEVQKTYTSLSKDVVKAEKEVDTNPTEKQIEAGNYKKGHVRVQGLDITIENPKGSVRSGVDNDGKEWSVTMNNTYGYFKGTEGKDGDHIDTFLGNNLESDRVFVIDQVDENGKFDEHKVMLGFTSEQEAKEAYLSNYSEGWSGLGSITEMSVDNLKKWAKKSGKRVKPVSELKQFEDKDTTRFSKSLSEVNEQFNEDLATMTAENAGSKHLFLGQPSPILRSVGIVNKPLKLHGSKLKAKAKKHGFSFTDVKDLPNAVQNPIAIFKNIDRKGNYSILTELNINGNNALVAIDFGKGVDVDFNVVSSVFGKSNEGVVSWINKGYTQYINKEKALDYLYYPALIAGVANNKGLNSKKSANSVQSTNLIGNGKNTTSIAKIIENFENPKTGKEQFDDYVRFSKTAPVMPPKPQAKDYPSALDFANALRDYENVDMPKFREENDIFQAEKRDRRTKTVEILFDKWHTVKQMIGEVEKAIGRKLADSENSYVKENLRDSKATRQAEVFKKTIFNSLLEKVDKVMRKGKVSYEEVSRYMLAKHAIERNAYMKENNGVENGSGIETAEAEQIVKEFESKVDGDLLQELWSGVKKATQFTLETQYKSGLMSRRLYNHIKGMYDFYVPMRGWEEQTSTDIFDYMNRPFPKSSLQKLNKKTKGRNSWADDPLPYIKSMAETAIVTGGKNEVRKALLNMARNHKQPQLYDVKQMWFVNTGTEQNPHWVEQDKKPSDELIDKGMAFPRKADTKTLGHKITPMQQQAHHVAVWENGEKVIVEFVRPDVAGAINGDNQLDGGELGRFMGGTAGNLTRMMSRNFTTRNPSFTMVNLTRDMGYATLMNSVKHGTGKEFFLNTPKCTEVLWTMIFNPSKFDPVNNEMHKHLKEFLDAGGETGFLHLRDVKAHGKEMQRMLKNLKDPNLWNKTEKAGMAVLEFVEKGNRLAEDISRFATYYTLRQKGYTIQQSAFEAKEITVNFNRSGTIGGLIGNLYAFFNAGMQGVYNFGTVAQKHKGKIAMASFGLFALGAIMPTLCRFIGGKDDEGNYWYDNIPEYERCNHLIIPLGGKNFVKKPLGHILRAFYGWGESVDGYIAGKHDVGETLRIMAGNFIDDLSPVSLTGGGVRALLPTAIMPFYDNLVNENFAGFKIYKEPYMAKDEGMQPQHSLAGYGTANWLVSLSRMSNELGGGNDYRPAGISFKNGKLEQSWIGDKLDWNPSKVEHVVETFGGGMLTFLNNTYKLGMSATGFGEEIESKNVPIIRRFYREAKPKSIASQYYELKNGSDIYKKFLNEDKKYGNTAEWTEKIRNTEEMQTMQIFDIAEKQLKKFRKMEKMANGNKEVLQNIKKKKEQVQRQAVEQIKKIRKAS